MTPRREAVTREQDLILDLFAQVCQRQTDDKYDHMFISAYEEAQKYLIDHGIIEQEECRYE